jgi:MFS family permease
MLTADVENLNLIVIGSMSLITFLMITGISPAFILLARVLHVTAYTATYLTSSTTLAHGVGPVLWRPISDHYGRRPVWIVSTLGSCLFDIGCAYSYTHAAQQVCRILAMLFMSASVGIGTVVVTEAFFAKERATKMVSQFSYGYRLAMGLTI